MSVTNEPIDDPPCGRLSSCQVADLIGNGRPDVIVAGMGRDPTVSIAGKEIELRLLSGGDWLLSRLETDVFWNVRATHGRPRDPHPRGANRRSHRQRAARYRREVLRPERRVDTWINDGLAPTSRVAVGAGAPVDD